jgi:hypothetical protein
VQDLDSGEEVGLGEAPDLDGDGVPDAEETPEKGSSLPSESKGDNTPKVDQK